MAKKQNYQFSARAVIDRYKKDDMPLGWILPNDGYGAGYGQTTTLDGNIANLKSLGDYARKNGVEIGLWTQSNLHPVDSIPALLQRDIVKEVRDAGVRVLKTDVAWVGAGYSSDSMVLPMWLISCLTTAAMPVRSLLPSTAGLVHSVMVVYGRATKLVVSGSIFVSTSQLISALDSPEWVILRAIWTVSSVERTSQ